MIILLCVPAASVGGSLNIGAIAGGVTGALIGVILTIIIVMVIIFALSAARKKEKSGKRFCGLTPCIETGALLKLISCLYLYWSMYRNPANGGELQFSTVT